MVSTQSKRISIEKLLEQRESRSVLRFSTAGSVDDGKSTLIGRLLFDSKNIFEDTVSAIERDSAKGTGQGGFDLSLLTDGLKAEREQKITIDVAYRYFSTPKRAFILADTPGHEQYTRNMATGASTADIGLILADAKRGLFDQTRRHSFILSLLGVKHVVLIVNKMDLVDYSKEVFDKIKFEYLEFARRLGVSDLHIIPVSALKGDNVVLKSENMDWYKGPTVLEYLEEVYVEGDRNLVDMRFPVQYVIRPTSEFRGYAGQISSGVIRVGDEVIGLPSLKKTKIKSIESFNGKVEEAFAPQSIVLTLEDEVDISRGDMIVHPNNIPIKTSEIDSMVVWMGDDAFDPGKYYDILHTSNWVKAKPENLRYKTNVNNLRKETAKSLALNEVGRVSFSLSRPVFIDSYKANRSTGGFIIVDCDTNLTVGAGMIVNRLTEDKVTPHSELKNNFQKPLNLKKSVGYIERIDREVKLNQKSATFWMTGLSGAGKSTLSIALEKKLFDMGYAVYRLDGDNLRFGINKNLGFSREDRRENIRRVSEIAKLMNDAGLIVIASLISPLEEDRIQAKEIIGEERFIQVFVDSSLEVCEKRDTKGLYKKAREGELFNFTGISSPFEAPKNSNIHIKTDDMGIDTASEKLASEVLKRLNL